jgi:hypothetical protein
MRAIPSQKYRNQRVIVQGKTLDSKMEAKRFLELLALEQQGEISGLTVHPRFPLTTSFKDQWSGEIQRAITYVGDFLYQGSDHPICEDVKGVRTEAFKIKWKMVKARYPDIEFVLVTKPRRRSR